jgi:DNA polymerase-3 subunit alpha
MTSSTASTAGRRALPAPLAGTDPRNTYGVILYQEQVMQIAQVLAGYTLGGADMLRRAMGKKKPEEMAEQRAIFLAGAAAAMASMPMWRVRFST